MTSPSQIYMGEILPFMTPASIINAFQKLGHHPISALLQKKRKNDDKEVCIIQFANDDAAKQAVFKLNGKTIPGTGFGSTKFKLSQCMGSRTSDHNVWVGDLTMDVDDYHFFKYFAQHYKTLTSAKVIVDSRGVSRGYGFLRFSSEEEQKHCLKNMGGSLGLGCRPIRVNPVAKQNQTQGSHPEIIEITDDDQNTSTKVQPDDPWYIYTNWNQFTQPTEFIFVATNSKNFSKKNYTDPRQDLTLIDYNVAFNVEEMNKEAIERDCYLWDAIECTRWLPNNALDTVTTSS